MELTATLPHRILGNLCSSQMRSNKKKSLIQAVLQGSLSPQAGRLLSLLTGNLVAGTSEGKPQAVSHQKKINVPNPFKHNRPAVMLDEEKLLNHRETCAPVAGPSGLGKRAKKMARKS